MPRHPDCDGTAATGCEANTASDLDNCGGCSFSCHYPHSVNVCSSGVCSIAACATGFADCDSVLGTGCEVNIATDINNCRACGTVCPGSTLPHVVAVCGASGCDTVRVGLRGLQREHGRRMRRESPVVAVELRVVRTVVPVEPVVPGR